MWAVSAWSRLARRTACALVTHCACGYNRRSGRATTQGGLPVNILLRLHSCAQGEILPLLPAAAPGRGHRLEEPPDALPPLNTGTGLHDAGGRLQLRVVGRFWLPLDHAPHAASCPLLLALDDLPEGPQTLRARKDGYSLAWITLSDKGARGQREDTSGPAIARIAGAALPLAHSQGFLLPDEPRPLRALLTELALGQGYDLICTTGGTGLAPRDITPQVTAALLDAPLPGLTQAMLAAGLDKTPHAMLSRACAGVLGQSLVLNLPGSRKAVEENLTAVLPALPHALAKLRGDDADCGR